MDASHIMTRELVTVAPTTTLKEAVTRLLQYGVSGLPVLGDSGELVGMLTEGDLLRRTELGTERHLSRWSQLLGSAQRQASEFVQTHGRLVEEVMTRNPVFIAPSASLNKIVALMETHHIKRLPVLDQGRLVGIVSRADLLRALMQEMPRQVCVNCDDEQIRRSLLGQLDQLSWPSRTFLQIKVKDGVVELSGVILHRAERDALRVLAENAVGVKSVVDHLVWVEPLSGAVAEVPPTNSDVTG
jgi:CBS domain-containing protein